MGEQMPTTSEFSPSDRAYRSVADLPEAVRGQFVDVPGGGFVRKSVQEYEDHLAELAGVNTVSRYHDSFIAGVIASATGRIRRQEAEQREGWMREHAEVEKPVDVLTGNAERLLHDQIYIEMWDAMRKRLEEKGATGALYAQRDRSCGGIVLTGVINEQAINVHRCGNGAESDSGNIGKVSLDRHLMDEIQDRYGDAAMPLYLLDERLAEAKRNAAEMIRAQYANDPTMMQSKRELAAGEKSRQWQQEREEERRRQLDVAREALFGQAS